MSPSEPQDVHDCHPKDSNRNAGFSVVSQVVFVEFHHGSRAPAIAVLPIPRIFVQFLWQDLIS